MGGRTRRHPVGRVAESEADVALFFWLLDELERFQTAGDPRGDEDAAMGERRARILPQAGRAAPVEPDTV